MDSFDLNEPVVSVTKVVTDSIDIDAVDNSMDQIVNSSSDPVDCGSNVVEDENMSSEFIFMI